MINPVDFELSHLDGFESMYPFEDLRATMAVNLFNPERIMISLLAEGSLVSILGMNNKAPGVGDIWNIRGKLVLEHKLDFYRAVKTIINDYIFGFLGYHRLEITVEAEDAPLNKWAKSLGFKFEGRLGSYLLIDDAYTDHNLYAKVVI